MTLRRSAAIMAGIALSLALAACSAPTSHATVTSSDPSPFHIVMSATTLNVLVAPTDAGATSNPLSGTVTQVGSCIGLTLADGSLITVVWPTGTLALVLKAGLEVPPNTNQGTSTARFVPGEVADLTGGYYKTTSWIGKVPTDCPIGDKGVFVVATAKHPPAAK